MEKGLAVLILGGREICVGIFRESERTDSALVGSPALLDIPCFSRCETVRVQGGGTGVDRAGLLLFLGLVYGLGRGILCVANRRGPKVFSAPPTR
jgi:hypothetical protein